MAFFVYQCILLGLIKADDVIDLLLFIVNQISISYTYLTTYLSYIIVNIFIFAYKLLDLCFSYFIVNTFIFACKLLYVCYIYFVLYSPYIINTFIYVSTLLYVCFTCFTYYVPYIIVYTFIFVSKLLYVCSIYFVLYSPYIIVYARVYFPKLTGDFINYLITNKIALFLFILITTVIVSCFLNYLHEMYFLIDKGNNILVASQNIQGGQIPGLNGSEDLGQTSFGQQGGGSNNPNPGGNNPNPGGNSPNMDPIEFRSVHVADEANDGARGLVNRLTRQGFFNIENGKPKTVYSKQFKGDTHNEAILLVEHKRILITLLGDHPHYKASPPTKYFENEVKLVMSTKHPDYYTKHENCVNNRKLVMATSKLIEDITLRLNKEKIFLG